MNVRWVHSNGILLALLVIIMVAVGVLAILVVRQQGQATDNGQVYLETAPAAGAPLRANTPDPANVSTKPDAPSHAATGEGTAPVVEIPPKDKAPESAGTPTKPDRPAHAATGEGTAPVVEIPPKDKAPESAGTPTKPDRPAHAATGEGTAPVVEIPPKDKAPESAGTPTKPDRSTNSKKPPNSDAEGTVLAPDDRDQDRVIGVPTEDDQFDHRS
jgi:hypothetical protein